MPNCSIDLSQRRTANRLGVYIVCKMPGGRGRAVANPRQAVPLEDAALFGYLVHRKSIMIPTLVGIGVVVFAVIRLSPGDDLTSYVAELVSRGSRSAPTRLRFCAKNTGSTSRSGSNTSAG